MAGVNQNKNGGNMKITFLGTGANGGVPQLDCLCTNCVAAARDANLIRRRSSFLVETKGKRILIECGPDVWSQLQSMNLKTTDLDLVVVSHLHFDHANGLPELSGGNNGEIPVLMSGSNLTKFMNSDMAFLVDRNFVTLVDEKFGQKCGVKLFDIPHDPIFPTSGILIADGEKKIWISTDVENITEEMKKVMSKSNLVVFDSTFFDESVFPASKLHHMTVER